MNKEMKRRNKNMDKEEYYNRIEKINNRFKTDRVSADEEYQLVCQRNYLSTKYIEHLEQENKQLQKELEYTIGIVEHNRKISEKNKEITGVK